MVMTMATSVLMRESLIKQNRNPNNEKLFTYDEFA